MKGLRFIRSVPRWLLVRSLGGRLRGLATGRLSCLQYTDLPPPPLPAPDWVRLAPRLCGICGSDLSTIGCQGSPYFAPFTSTPFVMGHEMVATIAEVGPKTPAEWRPGRRVVLEPALGCAVRGIEPPCAFCAAGRYPLCANILKGTIAGGIQTGYCRSTGGGWSESLVAHPSQLHAVPDGLSDEEAVLVEPFSCALHAALKILKAATAAGERATVLVLGCGTIGLMTLAAYRTLGGRARVLASARFQVQAELARKFGADEVFSGGLDSRQLYAWVLERTGGSQHQPEIGKPVLLGGAEVVADCVGTSQTCDDALRLAAPAGAVVVVGMPGLAKGVDWTAMWHKELRIEGAYAYGYEEIPEPTTGPWDGAGRRRIKTMDLALEILDRQRREQGGPLKALVNRKYPLEQYRRALDDAFFSGRSGAFKVVFEIGAPARASS